METQYRIITNGIPAAWTGSLHDCLYNLAHRYASHNTAHTVTVAQCVAAGVSIVRA